MINVPVLYSGVPINITLIDSKPDNLVYDIIAYSSSNIVCYLKNLSSAEGGFEYTEENPHCFRVNLDVRERNISTKVLDESIPFNKEDRLSFQQWESSLEGIYEVSISINRILPEGLYFLSIFNANSVYSYERQGAYVFIIKNNYNNEQLPKVYNISTIIQTVKDYHPNTLRAFNLFEKQQELDNANSRLNNLNLEIKSIVDIELARKTLGDSTAIAESFIEAKVQERTNVLVPQVFASYLQGNTSYSAINKYIRDTAETIIAEHIKQSIPQAFVSSVQEYENRIRLLEQELVHIKTNYTQSNVTISDDGYWVINGVKSTILAKTDRPIISSELDNLPIIRWYITNFNSTNQFESVTNANMDRFNENANTMNGNIGSNGYSNEYNNILLVLDKAKLNTTNTTIYFEYKNDISELPTGKQEYMLRYKDGNGELITKMVEFPKDRTIISVNLENVNSNVIIIFNRFNSSRISFNLSLRRICVKNPDSTIIIPDRIKGLWEEKPNSPVNGTTYICENLSIGNNVMLTYYDGAWHTIWGARIDGDILNARQMYEIALNSIISK